MRTSGLASQRRSKRNVLSALVRISTSDQIRITLVNFGSSALAPTAQLRIPSKFPGTPQAVEIAPVQEARRALLRQNRPEPHTSLNLNRRLWRGREIRELVGVVSNCPC